MCSWAQRAASQVPGQETFDRDDQIRTVGCHGLQKRLWTRFQVAMQQDRAVLVQDTPIHTAGLQVDAAVKLVLLGVDSPEVSSS